MTSTVFAVIVHYMNWPDVLHTISDCIAEGIDAESIVFVDNGSPSAAASELEFEYPGVRIARSSQGNVGYGAAVNLGIEKARRSGAKRVLVLTHEVRLRSGCLAALSKALDDNADTAAAAPVTYLASQPSAIWSAGGDVSMRDCYPLARRNWSAHPVDWVDGCCFLVRVDDHVAIGGMFEPYFLYFEEVDYFLRLRQSGRGIAVVPDAVAYQEPGSMGLYYAVRNRILLARRMSCHGLAVKISVEHLAKSAVSFMSRRTRSSLSERLRGVRDGWRTRVGTRVDAEVRTS